MGEIPIDSNGKEFQSTSDDFSLVIPKGAIQEGIEASIQHGVVRYGPCGPFELPKGWQTVSPIVWLCMMTEFVFNKSIAITLPHCFECVNEDDCKSLGFLKAGHKECETTENGEEVYKFKPVQGEVSFNPHSYYGTLHTTHFCYYCIGVHDRATTSNANFCLVVARPLATRDEKWKVYFCVTYFLKTCLRVSIYIQAFVSIPIASCVSRSSRFDLFN